ncbi:sulfotransferase [Cyanobium sp. CH-040]|uniref:sulfotransferase n=1 Tax=Cyanobium sp. CH-040 TaxID=2823708 RepID=UPI0028F45D15|nr:sulfotransferase [Cyanobium sp. CH-040]MCP9926740.1 sulfotransferase [Cyanobium sp. CH-040]
MTRMEDPRKPVILVIGEAKCGTSTVHEKLAGHPLICSTKRKELHYFDRACPASWNYDKTFSPSSCEYFQQLKDNCCGDNRYRYLLDSTPSYLRTPGVESLVREMVPDPKFLVLVRDPVSRLHSNFWFLKRKGFFPDAKDFDEFVSTTTHEEHLATTDSVTFDYASNLERWFRAFGGREKFLVIVFEEMIRWDNLFAEHLSEFLCLKFTPGFERVVIPQAPKGAKPFSHYPAISSYARKKLHAEFSEGINRLSTLLQRRLPW